MTKRKPAALVVLVVLVLLAAVLEPAGAQDRAVRFDGRVQWIAGHVMVVQLDTGHSVNVHLLRVPQDQYAVLTQNERVVVTGMIADSSRSVIGASVVRAGDAQAP